MRLLASLSTLFFSGMVLATPLHNIVVFGDSLSDNGNLYEFMSHQLPPSPPYHEGRFSNGPVWIEYLAASYFSNNPKAHLEDYAFGGAGVSEDPDDDDVLFTLRREVNDYLAQHDGNANGDDLYVVWIGANNYLALPEDPDKAVQDVTQGITHSLQRLADKGAKHFLVVNVPDLGNTPAALEFDSIEVMTRMSKMHNSTLESNLTNLKQQYPDVEWLFYDMNRSFSEVIANPQDYGFTNINGTCSNLVDSGLTKPSVLKMAKLMQPLLEQNACDGYVFFDLVHPTGAGHKLIAEKAREALNAQGVEFIND